MKRKITIKDIAKELNIHHTTVSRALRNDTRISEKQRISIQQYANEHGYETNQNALDFRNKGSRVIALIVPNISHYTFSFFISQFCSLAQQKGLVVSVFQTQENVNTENEIIQTIIGNRVMGVVASISKMTQNGDNYRKLINYGIPLVFFDRVCDDLAVSKVMTDNFAAGETAVNYLHTKGYSRIAHITGPQHINVFRDRHNGVISAINKLGLDYQQCIIIDKEFETTDGEKALMQLTSEARKPDAILCDSFVLSARITVYCQKIGWVIPQDLALMSIANDPFSAITTPPQTILEQPLGLIAQSAFELLLDQVELKEHYQPRTIYHQVQLIERKTV